METIGIFFLVFVAFAIFIALQNYSGNQAARKSAEDNIRRDLGEAGVDYWKKTIPDRKELAKESVRDAVKTAGGGVIILIILGVVLALFLVFVSGITSR